MMNGLSPAKILAMALLGLGIGVGIRQWNSLPIDIPLELGGTQTGSLGEPTESPEFNSADDPFERTPDNSALIEVGGYRTAAARTQSEPIIDETLDELTIPEPSRSARRMIRELDEDDSPKSNNSRLRLISEAQLENNNQSASFDEEPPEETPPQSSTKKELTDEPASLDSLDTPPIRIAKKPDDDRPSLDLADIDRQIKSHQLAEAHQALSKIFWQQPEHRSQIQERIDSTATAIYFSPQPHVQDPYVVQAGDQLRKIASEHHIPWQYLARLNKVDPKRIREGQKLKVIDGPFGAVVTLRDFELVLHHRGQYVRSYRVCIGKDNSSPVGKFKVLNKVVSPQYTDPDGKVFAGTDPKNPLGKYWLDLGDSYGIHGTIEPASIGKAESRGCIRLLNEDVAEVHDILELGAEVIIRR